MSRLVAEIVACTPPEWDRGTLTVECDDRRLDYKLKNAGQPGVAVISDKLRSLIEELYILMARRGDVWTQATIAFHLKGKDVTFDASFQYARKTPQTTATPSKQPWWKFGMGR